MEAAWALCPTDLGRRSGWEAEELPDLWHGIAFLLQQQQGAGQREPTLQGPQHLSPMRGPEKEKVVSDPGLLIFHILRLHCPDM